MNRQISQLTSLVKALTVKKTSFYSEENNSNILTIEMSICLTERILNRERPSRLVLDISYTVAFL